MADKPTSVINEYFKRHYPADLGSDTFSGGIFGRRHRAHKLFPLIECADGFAMSVQANSGAYSSPRDDYADQYSAAEIGFPTAREELIMPHIEGGEDTDPTDTVYGYVPVEIIDQVIAKHGGLKDAAASS